MCLDHAGNINIPLSGISAAQVNIMLAVAATDGTQDQIIGTLSPKAANVLQLAAANGLPGANGGQSNIFAVC